MNARLLAIGRRLWSSPEVPASMNRRNLIAWARAVHRLGDRWLLAQHVGRRG